MYLAPILWPSTKKTMVKILGDEFQFSTRFTAVSIFVSCVDVMSINSCDKIRHFNQHNESMQGNKRHAGEKRKTPKGHYFSTI